MIGSQSDNLKRNSSYQIFGLCGPLRGFSVFCFLTFYRLALSPVLGLELIAWHIMFEDNMKQL